VNCRCGYNSGKVGHCQQAVKSATVNRCGNPSVAMRNGQLKNFMSEILIISASSNLPLCDILEHNALTAGVSNKLVGQTTRVAMQPC